MPGETLVGRVAETTAIDALLKTGGALTLVGTRGLGRTALLDAAVGPGIVLRAAGLDPESMIPFGLLHRILNPIKGHLSALPARPRAALARALAGHPALDRILVAPAVLGLLTRVARRAPLLCCVDDLHLADPESLATLAFCARRLPDRRLALLFTTTDQELPGVPASHLAPLPRPAARGLVRSILGAGQHVDAVVEAGQGNPQALVALATGVDPPGYAGWPERGGQALLVAACDDQVTPTDLLRTGVDLTPLAAAARAGIVRVEQDRVHFPHPVVRATIYRQYPLHARRGAHLLLARTLDPVTQHLRVLMHRAAADPDPSRADPLALATAGTPGPDAAAAALTRAAELTADPHRAATWLREAARHTWLAGRPHHCRVLLERSSVFAATPTCDGAAHLLAGELELRCGTPTRAVDLLLIAADRLTDRLAAARALVRACEALCFSGDRTRFADIAARMSTVHSPGATVELAMLLDYVGAFLALFGGAHRRALHGFRRVAEAGARMADADALIWAAAAGLLVADDTTGRALAVRAAATACRVGNLAALPHALEMRAYAEYWLGRYDEAEATCRDGARSAEAAGQDNGVGHHLGMLAVLAAVRGETLTVDGHDDGNRPAAFQHWALAVVDLREGRPADARRRLDAIADPRTGHGHVFVQTMATPYLVEAAATTDEPDERAAGALAALDRWATATGDPIRTALTSRCHALLAPRGSAEAEEHFDEALRWHALAGSPFERARTDLLYARDLRRRRRPRRARAHLLTALTAFQQVGAPAWEAQTAAELMATGHHPGVLTAQQSRIAHLAAQGATNREIAAKLFLSTRTVDHHMRNVFVRLSVHNRTELSHLLTAPDRCPPAPGPP